ncbi:MAG: LmbE family protein [Opitutus sp.]|nr:LmbE family protein [Opitutus sp.]
MIRRPVALAVAAHPDDIEFMMSGTLLRLRAAGFEIHYLNLADGSCGSSTANAANTRARRAREARAAAKVLGATFHPSLARDLEIFYEPALLRRLAALIRGVNPSIVLTHSLEDYMEDHMQTARLVVTATFARGMPNYQTRPARAAVSEDVTVYHALPHGLRDAMGRRVVPESFVNVTDLQPIRRAALAEHRSQEAWLDITQKMSSHVAAMEATSTQVGRMAKTFRGAEGWRRYNPLGFCAPDADPMKLALGRNYRRNPAYRRWLNAV